MNLGNSIEIIVNYPIFRGMSYLGHRNAVPINPLFCHLVTFHLGLISTPFVALLYTYVHFLSCF